MVSKTGNWFHEDVFPVQEMTEKKEGKKKMWKRKIYPIYFLLHMTIVQFIKEFEDRTTGQQRMIFKKIIN